MRHVGISILAALFAVPAFATATAAVPPEPSLGTSLLPIALMFVVFYLIVLRPQSKRMKEHRTMLQELKRGDEVVTGGGILGTVSKVEDDVVHITIAEGVTVQVAKQTIVNAVKKPATAPAKAESKKKEKASIVNSNVANDN